MKFLMTFITMFLLAGSANAVLLNITNLEGNWQAADPVPPAVTINNTTGVNSIDTARWGVGNQQSGYNFTLAEEFTNITLDSAFSFGLFEHLNFPIAAPSLNSIEYAISFDTNAPSTLDTILNFSHDETPNRPCTPACPDVVTVTDADLGAQIDVGGESYWLQFLGFSLDAGDTFSNEFVSAEQGGNQANLYAIVTAVPEPSVLALFGLALAGLGFARRRRNLKA